MGYRRWFGLVILALIGTLLLLGPAFAQQKKIVYWTEWEQNPDFDKWYGTKGKEFAKKTGYEVEVVSIPYQGYVAKYLAAFMGKSGAPDFFHGMAHDWCAQYDFCDKMPDDLAKLTANWRSVIEDATVTAQEREDARTGQQGMKL